jgi:hypothetical protein
VSRVRIAIQNEPTELVKDVARHNQRGTAPEKFSHSYQKQSVLPWAEFLLDSVRVRPSMHLEYQ